jgi:hypothetical protein
MDRPSRTKSHPAGSLSSSQPGGAAVLGQPSSLRPLWLNSAILALTGNNRQYINASAVIQRIVVLKGTTALD